MENLDRDKMKAIRISTSPKAGVVSRAQRVDPARAPSAGNGKWMRVKTSTTRRAAVAIINDYDSKEAARRARPFLIFIS